MSSEQDIASKIPKLTGAKDFIPWRRRMKAYIQWGDFELLGLTDIPENATSVQRTRWQKAMIRAKTSIILTLDAGPMAQMSDIIDDDEANAKKLWESIAGLYTASNEQTVIKLMQELEGLEYKDESNWETHLNKFHEILGKLSSLGKAIPDEKKASKLIRTLPDHFAPIAMVSSRMSYEDLVIAVETEISRRKMRKSERSKSGVNVPKASMANGGRNGIRDGRVEKSRGSNDDNICWVCGLDNHHSKECWHRADKLAKKGMPPYRGRGRGRRSGRTRGRGYLRGGRGRGTYHPNHSFQNNPQHYSQNQPSYTPSPQTWFNPPPNQGAFPSTSQNPSGQAARIQDQPPPGVNGNNTGNYPHNRMDSWPRSSFAAP